MKKRGRKPIGEKAMTPKECWQRWYKENIDKVRMKERCRQHAKVILSRKYRDEYHKLVAKFIKEEQAKKAKEQ